jgi:choline-sulfatase
VTSDHGEEFFDHGGTGHAHTLYEELIHIPLIVRLPWKNRTRGTHIAAEVGLADVLPTACDLLSVECPEHMQGRSLLKLMGGDRWEGYPRASFAEHFGQKQQAVRIGIFKAIFKGHAPIVFNLQSDPGETTDIAGDNPITTVMLRDALGKHMGRFITNGVDSSTTHFPETHKEETAIIGTETELQLRALGYTGD